MPVNKYKRSLMLQPPPRQNPDHANIFDTVPVYLLTDKDGAEKNIVNSLETDADRYRLSRSDIRRLSFFCRGSAGRYIGKFIEAAVYGNEELILEMLDDTPSVILESGHVERGIITDYSERKYSELTAYQLALCAGDDEMAAKMKDVYLKKRAGAAGDELTDEVKVIAKKEAKAKAQAELDKQFDELFPNGYAAHLEEQKKNVFNFDAIIKAINNATPKELRAVLKNPDADSALGRALKSFREAFTEHSLKEKVFNPHHLQKAFQLYNEKFEGWRPIDGDRDPNEWLKLDIFWRQMIGYTQRYLPTNYMQAFCTGIAAIVEDGKPLKRELIVAENYTSYKANSRFSVFPLEPDCPLGIHLESLGLHLALDCYGRAVGSRPSQLQSTRVEKDGRTGVLQFQRLCETKAATLGKLRGASPRAIVQAVVRK